MIDIVKQSIFPYPDSTDEDGLLCIGGNLDVETLADAYYNGIFPWPQEGLPILWFCPLMRGILNLSKLHVPERLKRIRNSWKGEFKIDSAFKDVITACRMQKRPDQRGTWIIPEMIDAYYDLHEAGYAHCVEAWESNELVGGIYGVYVGNVFSGESMFYKVPNMSKLCLWYLAEHLKEIGIDWMDMQMLTPVTESFGGEYITREEFLKRLQEEHLRLKIPFYADSSI